YYDTEIAKRRRLEGLDDGMEESHSQEHRGLAAGDFAKLNLLMKRVVIGPISPDPFKAVDIQEVTSSENSYCCDADLPADNAKSCEHPDYKDDSIKETVCDWSQALGSTDKLLFSGIPLGQLWVEVKNILISQVKLGNVVFSHRVMSDTRIEVDVELIDIGLWASVEWSYWLCSCSPMDSDFDGINCDEFCKTPEENADDMILEPNSGSAAGSTSKSYLFATVAFEPNKDEGEVFGRAPPRTSSYPACPDNFNGPDPDDPSKCMYITFDDMEFSGFDRGGTLTAKVATLVEPLVIQILEGVVEDTVLRDLVIKDLLTGLFNDLMADLNPSFDKWINAANSANPVDPLAPTPPMLAKIAAMGGYSAMEQPKHLVELFDLMPDEGEEENWVWGYVRQAVDGLINVEKDEFGNLPDPEDITYDDIKINGIINSISTPKDSGLVKIQDMNFVLMNGTDDFTRNDLTLESLYIGGLNTFKRANVLQEIDKYTIENVLVLDKLSVEFDMRLKMWPTDITDSTIAQSTNELVEESFHISSLSMRNVTVDLKLLTALDKYLGKGIPVGSLYDDPMNCAPTAMHAVNMSYLNVTAKEFEEPVLDELIDPGTSIILNSLAQFVFESYGGMMIWLMPQVAQTSLRNMLSGILNDKMQGQCTDPEPQGFIDFTKEKLVETGLNLLNDNLLNDINKVNDLVRGATNNGTVDLMSDFNMSTVVPLGPKNELGIEVALWDVKLSGVDTFTSAVLLDPKSPFVMHNNVELAKTVGGNGGPLSLELDIHIGLMNNFNADKWSCGGDPAPPWGGCKDAQIVRNSVHLSLNMDTVSVLIDMLLKANKQRVKQLKMREVMSPRCWYGTLDQSQINDFIITFAEFAMGFECKGRCSSDGFLQAEENSNTEEAVEEMTNNFNRLAKKFTEKLMGTESSATLQRKADEATDVCGCHTNPDVTVEGPRGAFENIIDPALTLPGGKQWPDAETCDAGVRIDPGFDSGVDLNIDAVITGAKVIVGYMLFKFIWSFCTLFLDLVRGKSRRQMFENRRSSKKKATEEYNLFKTDRSLAFHGAVTPWMRVAVPLLLWMCIGLFMLSHTSILASIDIKITIGGDVLDFKGFQIMMLKESLEAMWEAEVYSLFFILFGFSFLWPYIKLFSLLFTWHLPPWILTVGKRGSAISMLDLLGKWSLVDIYVFVLIMSAFLMHIYSPPAAESLLGLSFYQIDLQVTPLLGLLASMIAGVVMPATNEVMILAHRDAVADTMDKAYAKQLKAAASTEQIGTPLQEPPTEAEGLQAISEEDERDSFVSGSNPMLEAKGRTPERRRSTWIGAGTDDVQGFRKGLVDTSYALCDHVWENEGSKDRVALKKLGQILVALICLCPVYFCYVGGSTTSWSYDRNGLVGILIDMGEDGADLTDYSIWNVGLILVEKELTVNFLEVFAVNFCMVCCVAFAFVCPILQQIVMVYVWVKPMTLKQLKIWYFVIEVLSGWATMDVFLVSIIVAMMQVGMLSEVMIPPICQFLNDLVPYGFVDDKDMTCFYIEAYLGYGCLIIAIAVITSTFTLGLIQGAAMSAIEDRENRIKGVAMIPEVNLGSSKKFSNSVFWVFAKMYICDLSRKEEFVEEEDNSAFTKTTNAIGALMQAIMGKAKGKAMGKGKGRKSRSKSKKSLATSGSSFDDDDSDYASDSSDDESFQPAPPPLPPAQRKSSVAPPRTGLPPGWTEQTSENGTYYWNFQTGVTTWETPEWPDDDDDDDGFVAPPPAPPGGGVQMQNMDGRAGMT
ncbi:hypothetical protein TeGR_g8129, partial [Tetraparma gracilis]